MMKSRKFTFIKWTAIVNNSMYVGMYRYRWRRWHMMFYMGNVMWLWCSIICVIIIRYVVDYRLRYSISWFSFMMGYSVMVKDGWCC